MSKQFIFSINNKRINYIDSLQKNISHISPSIMHQQYTSTTQDTNYQHYQEEHIPTDKNNFYSHHLSLNIKNPKSGIKFPQRFLVNSVHLAYDLSILAQVGYRKIQHYSHSGHLLYEQQFEKLITSIFMADSKTVIILLRSMNEGDDEITQINLNPYQKYTIPFISQLKLSMGVEIFKKSSTFCIKQQNQKPKRSCLSPSYTDKIKLTYYRYPLKNKQKAQIQTQPLYACYLDLPQNQQKNLTIKKLNNEGLVAAYQELLKNDYKFDIFLYNPEQNSKYWKKYTFNSNLKKQVKCSYLSITNLWQYQHDIFYVSCQLYPQDYASISQKHENQSKLKKMQKSYDFLWKFRANSEKKVSESGNLFHLVHFLGQDLNLIFARNIKQYLQKSRQARSSRMVTDYYGYQHPTVDKQLLEKWIQSQPKQQKIPIHYINPKNKNKQQVTIQNQIFKILEKNQKPSARNLRLASVCYDQLKFLEFKQSYSPEEQNNYTLDIKVKILRQLKYPSNIIIVFFMTEIINKCDEDLILYVTQMLYQDESQPCNHIFN